MQRWKICDKEKRQEEAKLKALAKLSGVSPVHKEDLLELAAFVRGRKRRWWEWMYTMLYTVVGLVAFYAGLEWIEPPEYEPLSVGSAFVLKLMDSTGEIMTEAQFLPNQVPAANPFETLGYGAISFGVALIAIGLSLMPKMHDKELDNLVSSMAISMSDRLPSRPVKSEDSKSNDDPVDSFPVVSDHPRYDPYDPSQDVPAQ